MSIELCSLSERLSSISYPGRGILLGNCGDSSVVAYFIMGRSENSRNRIFTKTPDGIRTEACDPAKMADPSLVIYHPVRKVGDRFVVTNGDQTDTIRDFLVEGKSFEEALRTREFEPDYPNCTPRISGMVFPCGGYSMSILKAYEGKCLRQFFEYPACDGVGHFISTYQGDGNPLPSFAGEPVAVTVDTADANILAERLWNALNADNKISLYVRSYNRASGEEEVVVINKYRKEGEA